MLNLLNSIVKLYENINLTHLCSSTQATPLGHLVTFPPGVCVHPYTVASLLDMLEGICKITKCSNQHYLTLSVFFHQPNMAV